MQELFYSVSNEVFEKFPGYVRGVVIANNVKNGDSPQELIQLLRDAETLLCNQLKIETLVEDPRIKVWREAFRSFGAKPSEFRPSLEAMARRVLRGDQIPSINALVDIGNIISLRHLVNVGGHAIDGLTGNMVLRPATGHESFIAFGSNEVEHPLEGEIIFAEGDVVLTRRWAWRQSNHTLTLPSTTDIEFNIDGLPPVAVVEVEDICNEVTEMVGLFCGGQIRHEILTQEHPCIKIRDR
jgi:DNA/RNA-binding domain of Phe-tRNA-synthetase-like protein